MICFCFFYGILFVVGCSVGVDGFSSLHSAVVFGSSELAVEKVVESGHGC